MSIFTGLKKVVERKYYCPTCGTGTDHPSGYCENCAPPSSQPQPPVRSPGRYLRRGDSVSPTDPFNYMIFNDLIQEIEALKDRVAMLDGGEAAERMCAQCEVNHAMLKDYLCKECRG